MAKRKSKVNKNKILSLIKFGAILFTIIGALMFLIESVKYFAGDTLVQSFNGLQAIFGYSTSNAFGTTIYLNFSFAAFLCLLLPLIGCFSVLFKNKIVRLVGTILLLVGTILCFFIPNLVVIADTVVGATLSGCTASIGAGSILAGIFFILATLCNLYAVVKK